MLKRVSARQLQRMLGIINSIRLDALARVRSNRQT
jgi:hypothetical protein